MALEVKAVWTDDGRDWLAQYVGNKIVSTGVEGFFRYGEGGFVGAEPKEPLPSQSPTIDALGFGVNALFFIQKALAPGDIILPTTNSLEVSCLLDFGEANDRGDATPPVFFEIGLFESSGVMVAYGTFPSETKTILTQLLKKVTLQF